MTLTGCGANYGEPLRSLIRLATLSLGDICSATIDLFGNGWFEGHVNMPAYSGPTITRSCRRTFASLSTSLRLAIYLQRFFAQFLPLYRQSTFLVV